MYYTHMVHTYLSVFVCLCECESMMVHTFGISLPSCWQDRFRMCVYVTVSANMCLCKCQSMMVHSCKVSIPSGSENDPIASAHCSHLGTLTHTNIHTHINTHTHTHTHTHSHTCTQT